MPGPPSSSAVETVDVYADTGDTADGNAAYMRQLIELIGSACPDSIPLWRQPGRVDEPTGSAARGDRSLDTAAFEACNELPRRSDSQLTDAF